MTELEHHRWKRAYNRKRAMKKALSQTFDGKNLEEVRNVLSQMLNAASWLWKDGCETYYAGNPLLKRYL